MTEVDWLTLLPDLTPYHWAAVGAGAVVLLSGVLLLVKRMLFPKKRQVDKPRRSLADLVTRICAGAALIVSGEGVFEVVHQAAPDVPWLPWLSVGLLEGPLLAFALRAKEAIDNDQDPGPAIRMTWLLAGLSSVIASSSTLASGNPGVSLVRAITPIVGAILWHYALQNERGKADRPQSESRWKWTPEYLLTRLGLLTARASATEDAEVHIRLTKVADATIRYARAAQRNTRRNTWWDTRWNTFRRWRMERVYRAAERDLDLTRNTDRRALLEQIIASRSGSVLLTTLAGATRADLGLPDVEQPAEQPARNTRMIFHAPVEQPVRNTRILFHETVVEQPVKHPVRTTRMVFHTPVEHPVEHPARNGRNTPRIERRNTNGANGRNTGKPHQNGDGKPTREDIHAAIAANISPTGEVPVRSLAKEIGVSPATLSRYAGKYREEHGYTSTTEGVIPPPRSISRQAVNDLTEYEYAPVGGGDPN
ncbi:hypothetical protein GCM10022252_75770 [Streptosporangium oxazolinicum]|uniref:Uncharacterized protein n=1 Tax=Streptosporangium oxazolinicum TaxID=909287 RepID=A0ABP8BKW6_9ACTN